MATNPTANTSSAINYGSEEIISIDDRREGTDNEEKSHFEIFNGISPKVREIIRHARRCNQDETLKFPSIVVVGDSSAGKSSTLNRLVGLNIFFAKEYIYTQCPVVLAISGIPSNSGHRFEVFVKDGERRDGVVKKTSSIEQVEKFIVERIVSINQKRNQRESNVQIYISLKERGCDYSLEIIDTPSNIYEPYLTGTNSFIWVHELRTKTVQVLENVPYWQERTIGVITKADVRCGVAQTWFSGNEYLLHRGWYAVINNTSYGPDLNKNEAWYSEKYLSDHKDKTGIKMVQKAVSTMLQESFVSHNPSFWKNVDDQLVRAKQEESTSKDPPKTDELVESIVGSIRSGIQSITDDEWRTKFFSDINEISAYSKIMQASTNEVNDSIEPIADVVKRVFDCTEKYIHHVYLNIKNSINTSLEENEWIKIARPELKSVVYTKIMNALDQNVIKVYRVITDIQEATTSLVFDRSQFNQDYVTKLSNEIRQQTAARDEQIKTMLADLLTFTTIKFSVSATAVQLVIHHMVSYFKSEVKQLIVEVEANGNFNKTITDRNAVRATIANLEELLALKRELNQ